MNPPPWVGLGGLMGEGGDGGIGGLWQHGV